MSTRRGVRPVGEVVAGVEHPTGARCPEARQTRPSEHLTGPSGVSRQTIMQRVKRGELKAVHVRTGRRKGLRIQPPPTQEGLF